MSTLTELLPSGGSGKGADFVASGALSNGSTVVLKSDGTVEVVSGTSYTESIPAGSEVVFNTGSSSWVEVAFDPNNAGKFVVSYRDVGNSNYGTACVGTVSGTSITFGTSVVYQSATLAYNDIAFDPNSSGKCLITSINDSSGDGTVRIGTISGSSITFGTAVVFASYPHYISLAPDTNVTGQFVVAYRDMAATTRGFAKVISVSGSSISAGTAYQFNLGSKYISAAFDSSVAGKFIICYSDYSGGDHGEAIIGTISGTTISYGTMTAFNSASTNETKVISNPGSSGVFVVAYRDEADSRNGNSVVLTISGTSISVGSEYGFNVTGSFIQHLYASFGPSNKFIVSYKDGSNSEYGTVRVGTVSGASISYGSEYVFNTAQAAYPACAFDPNNSGKFVVCYQDYGNSQYGTAIVGQVASTSTNLTADNFLGISDKAYADTATATVTLKGGISTNQSSLTVGSDYYVQSNGTLSTTTSSVKAGKAMNATTLKLTGE